MIACNLDDAKDYLTFTLMLEDTGFNNKEGKNRSMTNIEFKDILECNKKDDLISL